ncbi:aminodeoxychorismate lyase [Salinimonas marina]|uniref:Aminodeoxychorismate lyase n=1 Tax=Salinimonas marina TaxID=2785918 RepID=A0A7S9HBQ3_9ALTE|nr:aminodeoxychorismate lyase [Salinimonas marina]QPG04461.1 aminodeoxychorismate lyase [Salinimonas marina]
MTEFAINDRLPNYGDGLFTTMLVNNGRIALFAGHVARLQHNAQRLGIALNTEHLQHEMRQQARQLGDGTLKLLVSAGAGGRGYKRDPASMPGLHFSGSAYPAHYRQWQAAGIGMGLSTVTLARQPALAGLKHTNRLEQVLIKQAMPDQVDDVLVCDTQGMLIEASAANVFWRIGQRWFTPDLSYSGVAGVMREFVLAQFAANGVLCEIGQYASGTLAQASNVFICNALMQMVPVHTLQLNHQTYRFPIDDVLSLQRQWQPAFQDEYDTF